MAAPGEDLCLCIKGHFHPFSSTCLCARGAAGQHVAEAGRQICCIPAALLSPCVCHLLHEHKTCHFKVYPDTEPGECSSIQTAARRAPSPTSAVIPSAPPGQAAQYNSPSAASTMHHLHILLWVALGDSVPLPAPLVVFNHESATACAGTGAAEEGFRRLAFNS